MRFKMTNRTEWHRWFAWRPVRLPEMNYEGVRVPKMCVWLETIERKREYNLDEKRVFTRAISYHPYAESFFRRYVYRLRTDGISV